MSGLAEITSMEGYLKKYGKTLATRAIKSLRPLHVPGRDPVPDFSYAPEGRQPFDAQRHLIAAAIPMMEKFNGGFFVAEPGVGKSICAVLTVNEHSRRHGGANCWSIVCCPDHLMNKWEYKEILATLPEATVWMADKWHDFLHLMDHGHTDIRVINGRQLPGSTRSYPVSTGEGECEEREAVKRNKVIQYRKHWKKPEGPMWIVAGRNQIKWEPNWSGLGQPRRSFSGKIIGNTPSKRVIVEKVEVKDADGKRVYDKNYNVVTKPVFEQRICCPKCGAHPLKKGVPLSYTALDKTKKHFCEALWMQEIPAEGKNGGGLDRIYLNGEPEGKHQIKGARPGFPWEHRNAKPGSVVNHAGKRWRIVRCNEPLWSFTEKPYRWPPATIIQRKLRRLIRYLVTDEVQDIKSDTSGQSMAGGKVMAATDYCLALTGTFIGGYAWHLFAAMFRLAPKELLARGFKWGDGEGKFTKKYGCVDRITYSETSIESYSPHSRSMRRAKVKVNRVDVKARPGIMPSLFSEVVMPMAIFLRLEQFIDDLPGFRENIIRCELPSAVQAEYDRIQDALVEANSKMIQFGNMKLLGTMLWTLLTYPDHPWGWEPMFPALDEGDAPEHAVGWWEEPHVYTRQNWRGIVTPQNFDMTDFILPKERQLIDICRKNLENGDQTWVYCETTRKYNVMPRLAKLLEAEGIHAGILVSEDAEPREREEWICRNGKLYDVMLSHPQLVATGLDLFDFDRGNHNFNHLVFYQTGYNLFRIIQASRRGWRLGQPKDCTVTYLYYSGTSQAAALALMGRKSQAVQNLQEGVISDEGLSAMGGGGSEQGALVKALGEYIDPAEIQRNWSRIRSGAKKPRYQESPEPAILKMPGLPLKKWADDHQTEVDEALATLKKWLGGNAVINIPDHDGSIINDEWDW